MIAPLYVLLLLRAAWGLNQAQIDAQCPAGTISVSAGAYTLTSALQVPAGCKITIEGATGNAADAIISGQYQTRLFVVSDDTTLTLRRLTLKQGFTDMKSKDPATSFYGCLTIPGSLS